MGYALVVVQALPRPVDYVFDPDDPRAPTREQWAEMSLSERARVVEMLPARLPMHLSPPEGYSHRKAKLRALGALDDFFRRAGRRIYLSSELGVYHPDEPPFAPDLLAVLDVDPHERMKWVVADEEKGLDLVIEVYVAGDRFKDHELNVERYARLGIQEYFIFDRRRVRLHGYRLPPLTSAEEAGRVQAYQRIVPQAGRFSSAVLGLDLALDGERLRFFAGNAPLEDTEEMIARLGGMLDRVIAREESALRRAEELAVMLREEQLKSKAERRKRKDDRKRLKEEQKKREEEQKKLKEEQKKREELERLLAEARAELERSKR